jgi:NAD(P)-dependent dehydrogenase (short-subunit alcohol dehydrogenase family)
MGASHVEVMAREGASVTIADVLDDEGEAFAARLRDGGLAVEYRHLDVTSEADWEAAAAHLRERHGRADVLVNNAGIQSFESAPDETLEMWHKTIAVNQTGVFLGMKHMIPLMRDAGGGSIVNIASTAGIVGDELQVAYVASKGAVMTMTMAVALDHAEEGIRVNAVCPGLIDSRMAHLYGEEELAGWLDATPMRRIGQPEEISQVVVFLASDESSFVTGISLVADGGLILGQQLPLSVQAERARDPKSASVSDAV